MFNRTYVSNAPDGGVAMLEVLSDERAWMPFVPLCHVEVSGAFTGDISAAMLADAGADRAAPAPDHESRAAGHG